MISAETSIQFPYVELDLIQGSPEWHKWRKTKIGASDAASILGVDPWNTKQKKWEEKQGLTDPKKITEKMQRGIDLEPMARACFEEMTRLKMPSAVLESTLYPWMGASLDGFSKCRQYALEIKCNGLENHELALKGKIPKYYYSQLQHQLAVTALPMIYYFSFDGEKGVIIEVSRDESYIQKLIEEEKEFYQWVVTLCPPPQPYVERSDPIWLNTEKKWQGVTSQIKWLESQEAELREELIQLSGGLNIKGAGIKLSKEVRKGSVDYKLIPELANVDLEKYRKGPVECWKITQN
jgi:putative phage-type endonuclease